MYTKEELDKLPKKLKEKKLQEYHEYLKEIRKKERIKMYQNKILSCVSFRLEEGEAYKFKNVITRDGKIKTYGYYCSKL